MRFIFLLGIFALFLVNAVKYKNNDMLIHFPMELNNQTPSVVSIHPSKKPNSYIHRFFDTNPISPCGNYIALTRFPMGDFVKPPNHSVDVVIIEIATQRELYVGSTQAYSSQLGCQLQWGRNNQYVYYNDVVYPKNRADNNTPMNTMRHEEVDALPRIVGIKHDWRLNKRKILKGFIYQIEANANRYAISPDLSVLHYTQRGYGIDHLDEINKEYCKKNKFEEKCSNRNIETNHPELMLHNNGLYLTDLMFNRCSLLVSLYDLLIHVAMLPTPKDVCYKGYGFHTKWSTDGKYILFIIRTLSTNSLYNNQNCIGKLKRQSHMFVIEFEKLLQYKRKITQVKSNHLNHQDRFSIGIETPLKKCYIDDNVININDLRHHASESYIQHLNKYIHYVISWSSNIHHHYEKEEVWKKIEQNEVRSVADIPYIDGNHPNFIMNSMNISMNLMHISLKNTTKLIKSRYGVSIINIQKLISDKQYHHTLNNASSGFSFNNHPFVKHAQLYIHNLKYIDEVYPFGSGHPTIFSINFSIVNNSTINQVDRIDDMNKAMFILTDSYLKEYQILVRQFLYPHLKYRQGYKDARQHSIENRANAPTLEGLTADYPLPHDWMDRTTPIRLINIAKQTEVWLGHVTHAHSFGRVESSPYDVEQYAAIFYEYMQKNRYSNSKRNWFVVDYVLAYIDWFRSQYHAMVDPKAYYYRYLNHWRCDGHVTLGRNSVGQAVIVYNTVQIGSSLIENRHVVINNLLEYGTSILE